MTVGTLGVLVGTGVLIDMRRPSAAGLTGPLTAPLTAPLTDRQEIGKEGRWAAVMFRPRSVDVPHRA